MNQELLDLHRQLYEVRGRDWSDTDADMARVLKNLQNWPQVLQNKCTVLVGSANSGKTSELRLQVERLRQEGAHACFIAVRELLGAGSIDDSLQRRESMALAAWDKLPTHRLYVFLDSIDEATLSGPWDLKACLRKLVNRVRRSLESVTWVLSTRPAVLNQEVIEAIEDALEVTLPIAARSDAGASSIDQAASAKSESQSVSPTLEHVAKVFRLSPLSRTQARTLLDEGYKCEHVDALIEEADRLGLGYHLLTPGKCKLLTKFDLLANPPTSLGDTYRRSVLAHLDAPTSGRRRSARTSRSELETEALRLACASTLCDRLNIELPSESEDPSPNALSARTIVRALLDSDLQYLLSTDFFEESGHQQVKIQPDDIRFYLAARRLSLLISGPQDALKLAQLLGWRAPTGERGIFEPFMPVAGWLSSFDSYFRNECMKLDPQCVAFFGDLRSVPPEDAQESLDAAITRVASGERIGRGSYHLTPENYWQAGAPSVLKALPKHFAKHGSNEDVRGLLLDIARSARSPVLLADAIEAVGTDYQRVLDDTDLLQYVLEVGTVADKKNLRSVALKTGNLPDKSLGPLLRSCAWSILDSKDIVTLVRASSMSEGRSFVLSYVLTRDVAASASTENLCELTAELLDEVISALPLNPDDSVHEALDEKRRLAETVAELLAELVGRKQPGSHRRLAAKLVVKFQTELLGRDYSSTIQADELRAALQEPSEMRSAVVRELFRACKPEDANAAWRVLYVRQPVVLPLLEEARTANAVEFAEAIKAYSEAVARSERQSKGRSKQEKTIQVSESARKDLTKRKAAIKSGADTGALAWVAQVLSSTSGLTRYGQVELTQFQKAFGDVLTSSVEQGLKAMWRRHEPRHDEDKPRSTYWVTIAALQGLHLEFTEATGHLPSSKAELQRALDYGLYEMNGVPKWYWRLVASDFEESIKFFRKTIQGADKGAVSKERAAKVLALLEEAPTEIQNALSDLAWASVCSDKLDQHQTNAILSLIVQKRLVPTEAFNEQAIKVLLDDPGSPLATIWSVNWIAVDSAAFMAGVQAARRLGDQAADALIAAVGTALEDGYGPNLLELSKTSSSAVIALKQLYLELVRVVPREKDEPREPYKAYSVEERERAQRTRDKIPSLLAATHSTAGYLALKELLEIAKSERERSYYAHLMHQTAEAMARQTRPMNELEYLEFEQTLQARPDSLNAFAQNVENDILEVKDIVEIGEFSPRRFLATNYQDLEAGAQKAMEDDFQLFLAGQLAVVGRKRYSVFREPQDSEDARRDITVADAAHNWKVTLELKVTEGGWTVENYRDSLRNQLVGQYMKERHTTVGFFIVLLQRNREWSTPTGDFTFEGLLDILRSDALLLQASNPELRLRVIGIDATEPRKADGTVVRAKAEPKAVRDAKKAAKARGGSAAPKAVSKGKTPRSQARAG